MKPSAALSKQAKAAESQAQTLVNVEAKLDLIMAKLGITFPSVEAEVTSEPVVEPEPVVETPVEAEDKPAKKKK